MVVIKIIFWISVFIIIWSNVGYTISLLILDKIFKKKKIKKDYSYEPTVTLMIVAHNEEKVIAEKIENVKKLDYPKNKLEILIASDNSTDKTNTIVEEAISVNKELNIKLYKVKERKGKTNAQNEAARLANNEILVMTDANSILDKEAIKEIVASFSSPDIAYVTGRLCYRNEKKSTTSQSESTYWNIDTKVRDIESRIQTITAGNGALYACKTKEYIECKPIQCHDSSMPVHYALEGKRAIANNDAVAFEKAGENIEDEFKRKIRMNRIILSAILPNIKILNFFKYRWFTYFYLGHRTCRYLLWLMHIQLLITSIVLASKDAAIYKLALLLQIIVYTLAIIRNKFEIKNKLLNIIYYYCITILAQIIGVINIITGKAKPFWEKAESTR